MSLHATPALSKCECIAVVTAGRYSGTACYRVPCGLSPFDLRLVAHEMLPPAAPWAHTRIYVLLRQGLRSCCKANSARNSPGRWVALAVQVAETVCQFGQPPTL